MQILLCRGIPALLYLTDKQKFQNLQQLNCIQTFAFLPDKGLTSQIKSSSTTQFNLSKLQKNLRNTQINHAQKSISQILNQALSMKLIRNYVFQKLNNLDKQHLNQKLNKHFNKHRSNFKQYFKQKSQTLSTETQQIPFVKSKLILPKNVKYIQVYFQNNFFFIEKILNEVNQSHSLDIIDDDHHRKLNVLQNQLSANDLEQVSFVTLSNYYYLESVKHIDSTPLYQNKMHFQNQNISKQILDTEQYEQKGTPQLHCALFPISSPRQNILSNTTLISPRIQKVNTSQNNITLSKVKMQSNENLIYSQDFIPGKRDTSTFEQNINLNPTKIKSKISEKVEDQLNIWQFDQFNQFHQKPNKIRKIKADESLNSNISTLEKRFDSNLKSKGGDKSGRISQNLKEGATASIKRSISHSTKLKRTTYSKIKSTKKRVLIIFKYFNNNLNNTFNYYDILSIFNYEIIILTRKD
ncbi:hypothetical protein ABPG72_005594 [Tetrahymena utriculariae]